MPPNVQSDLVDKNFLDRINISNDQHNVTNKHQKTATLNQKKFKDLILAETNCEYYLLQDFKMGQKIGSLNIFHNNFNGLESKHDLLHEFLINLNHRFDLITITETSEKNSNKELLT